MSVSSKQLRTTMFTPLHSARIPIRRRELGQFFAVDGKGDRLTLGDYIELSKKREFRNSHSAQRRSAQGRIVSAADPLFTGEEMEELVDQYLESISDDEVFEIVGLGSFKKEELREQVRLRTSIGLQIMQMILDDRNFVEEQIKRGNYELPE